MIEEAVHSRGFEIIEQIGAGGFGAVYRAHQPAVGRDVAIKVILPDIASDPLFRKRFEKEAHLAAQLEHPNIVPIFDYWQDETHAYLVMRWLRGGSLKEALLDGPFDPEKTVRLVDRIAGALETAHRHGVVHRDLKPSNIMLDEIGNAYLTDFGIAKQLDGKTVGTAKGTIIGSPEYMAPEQIKGEPVTPISDQYSLGGVIYEMLTGEPPFRVDEITALLYKQLNEPIPLVNELFPEIPAAVDTVLQRATAKDPDQRYADISRLAEAFTMAIRQPDLVSTESFLVEKKADIPHNLPVQSTPFVGREEELASLERMLLDPEIRLITIVGPGGIGKTRLALALAERQLGSFEHGIVFVSLASLDAAEDIIPAVARGLSFSFYEDVDHRQQLIDYLRAKSMLLLLDNFEHLLEGASLASEIIQSALEVQVIATSREPLRLIDEQLFSVRGLDFPGWEPPEDALEYDAVRLFLNSARRSRSDFEFGPGDQGPLTRICSLVQGMPLGIVLAAGWVELLSPAEIAKELGQGIDVLKTDLRDVPERQRSMRAVFDTTWDQLNRREREVFKRLSVFRGGCSQEAIRKVTGATLMELKSLTGKSLLNTDHSGRYELHELLRQYVAEKLERDEGADFEAHDRHCSYYLDSIAELEDDLYGPQVKHVMALIDGDLENVRSALRWAAAHQRIERLDRVISPLFQYYFWRDLHQETFKDAQIIVEGLEQAVSPEAKLITAKALARQGRFLPDQEDLELVMKSEDVLAQADSVSLDTRKDKAFILWRLAGLSVGPEPERGLELSTESLGLYREVGDRWGEAVALGGLAEHAEITGNLEEEKRLREEIRIINEQMSNPQGLAQSLYQLSRLAADRGDVEEAQHLARQSYTMLSEVGYPSSVARSSFRLGAIMYWIGLFDDALEMANVAGEIYEDLGNQYYKMYSNISIAWTYSCLGEYESATTLARQCLPYFESIGEAGNPHQLLAALALHRKEPEAIHHHAQKGLEIYRAQHFWLGEMWCLLLIGFAERMEGNESAFRHQLIEGLRISTSRKELGFSDAGMIAAALLFADRGEVERAVEIYELACQHPFAANLHQNVEDGKYIAAKAASLAPEVAEAARKRGRERDRWETAKEILAELEAEESQD